MSDLEELLREEMAELAGKPQPEAATILRRVRVARRRGTLTSAATAVLIVVTGAGLWLTRTPASPPPATPSPTTMTLPERAQIHFLTPDVGIALAERCTENRCTLWLESTSDGARTWHGYPVPQIGDQSVMRVFDENRVALDIDQTGTRWFTADAGRTWHMIRTAPETTIDHIPDDALAKLDSYHDGRHGITVLLIDGRSARLTNPPELPGNFVINVQRAADGSLWARAYDDKTLWAYVSRDQGRTWARITLPASPAPTSQPWLETQDGKHVYLVDRLMWRVWRTSDEGRNWHLMATPVNAETGNLTTMTMPDGGLAMLNTGTGSALTYDPDGIYSFSTAKALGVQVGARYLRDKPYALSADGETWAELRF